MPDRRSEWATNQLYFADFAVSDIGANQFYAKQQFSRGAVGFTGATTDPRFRVWIEDWSITAQDDQAQTLHLHAAEAPIAIDLTTHQIKLPTLEGDHGLSQKGSQVGNASYYYSLTRLPTDGTLTVNGTDYQVTGSTWMDHEFSTSSPLVRMTLAGIGSPCNSIIIARLCCIEFARRMAASNRLRMGCWLKPMAHGLR